MDKFGEFKYLDKDKINSLPGRTGVYCFKNRREILYIGKAANLRERIKNHFLQPSFQDNFFIDKIKKVGYIQTESEIEALILEANLIKKHEPKFNVMWKDDKNYFFVGITKEDFPQIFITHQPIRQAQGRLKLKTMPRTETKFLVRGINYPEAKQARYGAGKPKTEYVGPFVDGRALKETLKILRKVFPYRTCENMPKHPCLWYQLSRCPAPCQSKIKKAKPLQAYQKSTTVPPNHLRSKKKFYLAKIKNECKQNAKNIIKILQGGKNRVVNNLKKEMKSAANSQNFEKAAEIRDKIYGLEKTTSHSKIFDVPEITRPEENWLQIQKTLGEILNTKKGISRIEAYDVSNIQGQQATGSMVVFIDGKPDKNQYRKFKIKIGDRPNDVAMIKEILTRRLNHAEWPFPSLILIDGGKAQLNAALNITNQYKSVKSASIRVSALAKKENKLYLENKRKPLLLKTLPREIFNLILQLRDEAHRFAITYHKKLRKKFLIR